jgi:hypothetical protein
MRITARRMAVAAWEGAIEYAPDKTFQLKIPHPLKVN